MFKKIRKKKASVNLRNKPPPTNEKREDDDDDSNNKYGLHKERLRPAGIGGVLLSPGTGSLFKCCQELMFCFAAVLSPKIQRDVI